MSFMLMGVAEKFSLNTYGVCILVFDWNKKGASVFSGAPLILIRSNLSAAGQSVLVLYFL